MLPPAFARLRQLEREATNGPWIIGGSYVAPHGREWEVANADGTAWTARTQNHANAALIASLRTLAPRLLEALAVACESLEEIERHCPCGARPESPNTHPHVSGCPVAEALVTIARLGEEEGG